MIIAVDKFNTTSTMLCVLMIINIIACIMLSIILTGMEIANLIGYDLPCISGEGKEEYDRVEFIKKSIHLLKVKF